MQQTAESVLAELCSTVCQQALQDAVACWVFIFRQLDARSEYKSLAEGMLGHTRVPNDLATPPVAITPAVSSHSRLPSATAGTGHTPAGAASAAAAGAGAVKAGQLLAGRYFPHTHKAWTGDWEMPAARAGPTRATAANFKLAQEVLVGWCNLCRKADSLSLQVQVTPASNTANSAALAVSKQAAAGGILSEPAVDSERLTADDVQDGLVVPAAPLLFGMLAEALQQLGDIWAINSAAVKAALVKETLSESSMPESAKHKKLKTLLGNTKASPPDQACCELMTMVQHLALVLTELLQLERTVCGGPGRDGTVLVNESGVEIIWYSCLWRLMPRSMCQVTELLLRSPGPVGESLTTLTELLLDDLWEAVKEMPLLEEPESSRAVAAVVASARKVVLQWHAAISAAVTANGTTAAKKPTIAKAAAAPGSRGKSSQPGRGAMGGSSKKSKAKGVQQQDEGAVAAVIQGEEDASLLATSPPMLSEVASGTGSGSGAGGKAAMMARPSAPPAWMAAIAAADALQALRPTLALLGRLLDNAQKAYYCCLSELQQKQQSAVALSLLEPISVGLHSNALLLTELSRWDLLSAITLSTNCAFTRVNDLLEVMRSKSAAVAAAAGINIPTASADLDGFDAFWQAVQLEPVDKLKLCQALAGLTVPAGKLAVGCSNPACCNISGGSELAMRTLVCSMCFDASYCSKECQSDHWRAAVNSHKLECCRST
eukprot:gene3873-4128_t